MSSFEFSSAFFKICDIDNIHFDAINVGRLSILKYELIKLFINDKFHFHSSLIDEDKNKLIDIHDSEVEPVKIKRKIPGKKIKSI